MGETLQWRHSERNGVLNQWRLDCLLNPLFRRRYKNQSSASPVTDGFPSQRGIKAENVSIHHDRSDRNHNKTKRSGNSVHNPWGLLYESMPWWRHQMETFSALLALCAGNSPVPVNSPHKGQWRGALMFSLICARINDWVNNREAGDLRRHRGHYDVNVMPRLCGHIALDGVIQPHAILSSTTLTRVYADR